MSLQTVPDLFFPPFNMPEALGTSASNMTAVGHMTGIVFKVPRAESISHVKLYLLQVSGTPANKCAVSIQTIDPTTGNPTGTMYAGSAESAEVTIGSSGAYEFELSTPTDAGLMTVGDDVAVVVRMSTFVSGGVYYRSQWRGVYYSNTAITQYFSSYNGSAWTKTANMPAVALRGPGGAYPLPVMEGPIASTNVSLSTSSVSRVGNKVTMPITVAAKALWAYADPSQDVYIRAYDSSNNLVASCFIDKDVRSGTGRRQIVGAIPLTTFYRGQEYRVVLEATSSTGITAYYTTNYVGSFDASYIGDYTLATGCQFTSYSAGAWTDNAQALGACGLVVNQIDCGGLLVSEGLTGGIN